MSDMMISKELQDVLFNIAAAEKFSSKWHDNIKIWRDLYDFNHYSAQPKPGETQFSDPTYTNTVDLATAILLANPITWRSAPWKPSANAMKLSSQIEKFLVGALEANSDRNEYDILYEIILHFVRDGGVAIYTYWDDDIAAMSASTDTVMDVNGTLEENITVYEECPLRIQVVDPQSILVLPGGKDRWMAIMRTESMTLFDVRARFGVVPVEYKHLENDIQSLLTTHGNLIDYWDIAIVSENERKIPRVRNAVLFDKNFIPGKELAVMPKYKSLPYTVGFYKPTSRLDASKWVGIIQPMIGSVRQLEVAINRRQRQIDIFSSMPFVAKTAQGRPVSVDPGLGKIVQISTEEDFGFPVWQGNPPDVERQVDFMRSRVQQSGFSDVFYGSGASAVSGYALSQLGDQNRIRLEQPVTHLERFYEWMAKKVIEITLENADPGAYIRMYGRLRETPFAGAVKVDYLAGQQISCEIVPEFPNEKVRNHAMATQVKGILSDKRIMERYLSVQQPDEEFDIRMIEQAQNNPVVVNYGLISNLKEMADAGDEVAAMTLTALQQSGATGMPGRPKEPNNPEQGRGIPNRAEPMGGEPGTEYDQMAQASPNMEGGVYGTEF